MARINLLPWREELREKRRKRFFLTLGAVLVGGLAVVLVAERYIDAAIERQLARNNHLSQQAAHLDQRIVQINELKAHRQQLMERMKIIEDLQGNRSISARVFDQLVRTLPDGVYFTDVSQVGTTLAISGSAESNDRISELMRQLDRSEWFDAPVLGEVKGTAAEGANQASRFQLSVRQTRAAAPEDQQ
ncbi:PilN domain-containing protein [Pseudomonas sp. MF4836]|uniref:PilN domain-containing protein n=1 Tax=Pseudomonas sp. MF4836 TaxID=1960827 RepID=UPI00099701EB|nr:PilN domain-containing protein [Pseudomonas sp. MF4836]OOV99642.1 pilus assembly protein PilN [Pseudomonas sp. MF4836]